MTRDKFTYTQEERTRNADATEEILPIETAQQGITVKTTTEVPRATRDEAQAIEAARVQVEAIKEHHLEHPMKLIGEGGESLVYDTEDGRVLKVGKPGYPVEFFRRNKKLFEQLRGYIGEFLPTTEFIDDLQGEDVPDELKGRPAMRQTKIEGKALHEITEEDLNDPSLLSKLIEFMKGVLSFKQDSGEMIDFYGKTRDWTRPTNVLDSANVKVQNNRPYLIDVGLVPKELQTEQGPVKISIWNAITGIEWALKERSLKKYFQHIKFAIRTRYIQMIYRIVYATVFPLGIRSLEKRLKKIDDAE